MVQATRLYNLICKSLIIKPFDNQIRGDCDLTLIIMHQPWILPKTSIKGLILIIKSTNQP
jgi:hypothetical protein